MSREDIIMEGKYVVLFYVPNTTYKMCVMKESNEKEELEIYIKDPPVHGQKMVDWYQVHSMKEAEDIMKYVKGGEIRGVTYNLVHE